MHLAHAVTPLFEYPVDEILAVLPDASSPLWDTMQVRQSAFASHTTTRSIVFRWMANTWQPGTPAIVLCADYLPRELTSAVTACADTLAQHFDGTVTKLMLAELAAGQSVAAHTDSAPALVHVHRCHVPIVTNPDVSFIVDDEPYHLETRMAYEFDNTRTHAVDNRGSERRVHLICDVLPSQSVR